jgi:hypothetical protein
VTSSWIQAIAESRDGIVIGTRIKLANQARPGIAVRQGQIIGADARHACAVRDARHRMGQRQGDGFGRTILGQQPIIVQGGATVANSLAGGQVSIAVGKSTKDDASISRSINGRSARSEPDWMTSTAAGLPA